VATSWIRNIISELTKPRPEPRVVQWVDSVEESLLYLSVLTWVRSEKGNCGSARARRRAHLEAWLISTPAAICGASLAMDETVAPSLGMTVGTGVTIPGDGAGDRRPAGKPRR